MFDFNGKRLILLLVVLVVATIATDFVIHNVWMAQDYKDTESVWRPESAMGKTIGFMFGGQILAALTFGMLYARGFASGNWSCALIYGFMMGLVMTSAFLIFYAVLPINGAVLTKWIVGSIIQGLILGALCKLVYGRGPLDPAVVGE